MGFLKLFLEEKNKQKKVPEMQKTILKKRKKIF